MAMAMAEVCAIQEADQFQPGKSAFECGFFAISMLTSMAPVGQTPTRTAAEIINQAETLYAQYNGNNLASNLFGMTLPQEYDVLAQVGLHYQGLPADIKAVKQYVKAGYPVLIAAAENSIFDLGLGDVVPYPWVPTGSHIVVVTGLAGNNLLCRDSANIEAPNTLRPGPRVYDASKLVLVSATAVVPPWLPRPGYPLKGSAAVSVPTGWKDDGTTLTAPNGFVVVKGFREYVLQNAWEPYNWPLENEHAVSQEEMSNPSLGGGTQQVFRSTVLEWTNTRGVYQMWVGQELLAVRAMLARYQSAASLDPSVLHQLLVSVVNATQPLSDLNAQAKALLK